MTSRYKKSILKFLNMLHKARVEPFKNIQKWLILQEVLIKKLIYVEERIRSCKAEIKSLDIKRKNVKNRLSKEESITVKKRIQILKYQIEEYLWIISILKSIGDGIAFTFIPKQDIKPQNFKESSGFISGKKGLILEKKILRYSFKNNLVAILNDITSVLRYADITLVMNNGYVLIEAKSSIMNNHRVKRQEDKTNKLIKYLTEDVTSDLYGDGSKIMRRMAIESPEINYIDKFNEVIVSAEKKGFDYVKFENGFTCLATFEEVDNAVFDLVVKKQGLTEPFAFHLNMYKFVEQGYYPFSLIYYNFKHYWDFLEGRLNILIFIDFAYLKKISMDNGYSIERSTEENWAFNFKSINHNSKIKEFRMSEHYFSRSFMELVSIEWLMEDSFDKLKNKEVKRI